MSGAVLALLTLGAASAGALMLLLWVIHLPLRNAAIVDVGWAGGLALLAAIYAAAGDGYPPRAWWMASLAALWGLRLALHLLFARVIGQPEEGRYAELRRRWGGNLPLKFLAFFEFQALLCVVLSVPFLLAAVDPAPGFSVFEYAGAALWLAAWIGESVADWQLKRFKSVPARSGVTCRVGLWKYSRHPNYFFEWLIWVAFALFATGSPYGYLAWISPLLILYFLFRVTGIPATEAQALRTKGEDYRRYQQTTSAFVPWFPKK
jgi:steroid 5-alpha reductase family enzyme